VKLPSAPFLTFVAIVTSIVAALHVYLWFRLVRAPAWPTPWRARATWTLVLLGASIVAGLFLDRRLPRAVAAPLTTVGHVWLAAMFYLFVLCVVVEPVRIFAHSTETARTLALAVVAATAAICVYGAVSVARGPYVERIRVPIRRLDPRLDGFRIVQISDLHVGPSLGRAFVERVVGLVNGEDADVVAITGDLVDGDVERVAPDVEPLANLRAKSGVLFVTGNHDFYSGADPWIDVVRRLGIRVLRNERVAIERNGAAIDFAGVEDPTGRSIGEGPDWGGALGGRDASRPVVVLAHQPNAVSEAARRDVDLVLSGHTHGGQLWPFGLIERPFHAAIEGLHRFGATQLYVSRGTGFWGPPLRVLEPAEVTVIELTRD